MAYVSGSLNLVSGGLLEGTVRVWMYTTADAIATVQGANYFTDGLAKGMQKGDIVWINLPATPHLYLNQVSAAPTSSGATVSGPTTSVGA
jgi:hypothetical protein